MGKRYGMVLDVDHCIGCYACVVACKATYGTRPGVDYNAIERVEWGEYPKAHQKFKQTMCMHCENPPCVEACPVQATYTTEEGVVVVDYDKCIGCGACANACPYDERHIVKDDVTHYDEAVLPFERQASERLDIVEKCTFCYERLKTDQQPMCTIHCPGQCRIFGDLNDPNSEINNYIKERNAVHVKGTGIYYVIPEGMDRSVLPPDLTLTATAAPVDQGSSSDEEDGNGSGVAVVAGIAGVAAVAGGYAYKKNKDKQEGGEE